MVETIAALFLAVIAIGLVGLVVMEIIERLR